MADGYREALLARVREAFDGRSDRELAKAAGVSVETVRRYRVGECVPGAEFLQALCAHMDVSAAWLLGGEGPRCKHELAAARLREVDNDTVMKILEERLSEGPAAVLEVLKELGARQEAKGGEEAGAAASEAAGGQVDGEGAGEKAGGEAEAPSGGRESAGGETGAAPGECAGEDSPEIHIVDRRDTRAGGGEASGRCASESNASGGAADDAPGARREQGSGEVDREPR